MTKPNGVLFVAMVLMAGLLLLAGLLQKNREKVPVKDTAAKPNLSTSATNNYAD